MGITEAGPSSLFWALSKNYNTQNSTELCKEIILHFCFQVAELDINKQNCLITVIYPDVFK